MLTLLSKRQEMISPTRASKILESNTLEYQRRIRKGNLEVIKKAINDGEFHTCTIALAKNCKDDSVKMANGQHCLTGCVETNKPIHATILEYKYEKPQDLAHLYRMFDSSTGARRLYELTKVEAKCLGVGWNESTINLVQGAALLHFGKAGKTPSDKVELFREFLDEGEFVDSILFAGLLNSKHMRRRAVVLMMIRTWQKSHKAAEEFWSAVRDGEHLNRNDARRHLRDWLLTATTHPDRGKPGASEHEIMYRCSLAWNTFRRGAPMTSLRYYPDKQLPALQ